MNLKTMDMAIKRALLGNLSHGGVVTVERRTRRPVVVETYRTKRGWAFRFKSGNGKILASSETYQRRRKAQSAAMRIVLACRGGYISVARLGR